MRIELSMKTKLNHDGRLTSTFADSGRFSVRILRHRDGVHRELSNLNDRQRKLIDLALNEAEALAWQTDFPQLVFPTLAEEKARAAVEWYKRQETILRRNTEHAFAA